MTAGPDYAGGSASQHYVFATQIEQRPCDLGIGNLRVRGESQADAGLGFVRGQGKATTEIVLAEVRSRCGIQNRFNTMTLGNLGSLDRSGQRNLQRRDDDIGLPDQISMSRDVGGGEFAVGAHVDYDGVAAACVGNDKAGGGGLRARIQDPLSAHVFGLKQRNEMLAEDIAANLADERGFRTEPGSADHHVRSLTTVRRLVVVAMDGLSFNRQTLGIHGQCHDVATDYGYLVQGRGLLKAPPY